MLTPLLGLFACTSGTYATRLPDVFLPLAYRISCPNAIHAVALCARPRESPTGCQAEQHVDPEILRFRRHAPRHALSPAGCLDICTTVMILRKPNTPANMRNTKYGIKQRSWSCSRSPLTTSVRNGIWGDQPEMLSREKIASDHDGFTLKSASPPGITG
jgi:hypothetical protein